ncbi:hypothetical protein ABPG75_008703 [Micractinium tetrahymenae]
MASRHAAARSLRALGSRLASSSLATAAARASPALLTRAFAAAAEPAPAKPIMENAMFCYQCEQTKSGTGCTTKGVCGKTPETTVLQDLLTYSVKGLSCWAHWAASQGVEVPQEVYNFIQSATFACLTNVNFDDARFKEYIQESHRMVDSVEAACRAAGVSGGPPAAEGLPQFDLLAHPAQWRLGQGFLAGASLSQLVALGQMTSLEHRRHKIEPTILGLQEMLVYGLRGLAAYTHHAAMLGQRSATVDKFIAEAYAFLCSPDASDVGKVLGMILKTGEVNLESMALLDGGHVAKFGHPEPSPVRLSPRKGKAILVSGHDMEDLRQLLDQTEGTGVNVYTHGEMLPAHGYPGLKKYKHLAGNFGNSWWRQQKDFAEFPGPILMTTNCIIEPRPGYSKRIFTTGEVGWEGVSHIDGSMGQDKDFSVIIKAAQEAPGFASEPEDNGEQPKTVLTGFARNAVLGVAGEVVKAVQEGHLKHIFLIGGCEGSEPDRRYFSQTADRTPEDTMILTLGCGKFRFYDHPALQSNIPNTPLPRLVDMGQCNDAYSAIVVADALAKAFNTDVNGLPLSLNLSWLEQKAIVVLLTLLHLGVKNIRIGPNPPAFLTPESLAVIVDKFNLKVVDAKHPEKDMESMLQNQ